MADQRETTLCPACGRATGEPHKPQCLPAGMTAAEVLALFQPLPPDEAETLREVGTR